MYTLIASKTSDENKTVMKGSQIELLQLINPSGLIIACLQYSVFVKQI